MSNYRSDPTANRAIGAVDKELARMRRRAQEIRRLRRQGRFTPEDEARARRQFVGIYRSLLRQALEQD